MTDQARRLLQQAHRLSKRERGSLAAALLDTLDDDAPGEVLSREEWEREWAVEIQRRVEEVRSGKAVLLDGDRVLRQERTRLKRAR